MSRSQRVLVLNHFAVPRGEPGGTRHVEMFGQLHHWNHLIIASRLNHTTGLPQEPQPGFVPVHVTPYAGNGISRIINWVSYLITSFIAGLRLSRTPPDVIYASSPHLLAGVSGYLLSIRYRIPFVLEIRDLWPRVLVDMGSLSPTSRVYRALTRLEHFLYRRADAIVVMAPGTSVHLETLGIPTRKIHYVPNGADPSDFAPSEGRERLRAKYGFTRFTAIYTGAHGPANGLDALLDAAELLEDIDVDIVLVGDGARKQDLMREAKQRRLGNVRFYDPVPKTEIPDLLNAADVGVHILADVSLFRRAVSPNKLFDYMAASLPVLTNSSGVVEAWVKTAGAGWYVDTHLLANKLRALSRLDPDVLRLHGMRGREWIEAHQSRSAMANRLERLLDSLMADE